MRLNIGRKNFALASGKKYKTPAGAELRITTLTIDFDIETKKADIHIMGVVAIRDNLRERYVNWNTLEGFEKAYNMSLEEIKTKAVS